MAADVVTLQMQVLSPASGPQTQVSTFKKFALSFLQRNYSARTSNTKVNLNRAAAAAC